jgi:hypothetical protein
MNRWEYFFFLVRQGPITGKMWYLTFFFCFLFALLLYKTFKINKAPYKKIYLLSLIPFLFPLFMLIWGTFFEHTNSITADIPAWQLNGPSWILYLQLGIHVACLVYFKGVRLLIAALAVLQMYFTLPFFLVAYMSVGGTWL